MNENTRETVREEVRSYYREAIETRTSTVGRDERWGASRYDAEALDDANDGAANLSMGCGNPHLMVDLQPGETVLDLGSGGGLDVILSAKRVAPDGFAYGVDFLDEMGIAARKNALEAGVENVKFLTGDIENVPLPSDSVDAVISNCVINLAPDKAPVFAEIERVLRPGGRFALSDVVAANGAVPEDGADWAGCGAGALQYDNYLRMLSEAGLRDVSIEFTHETSPGLHGAIVRGRAAE